jgi:hypothetical protein
MLTCTDIVREAIMNTPNKYFQSCLEMRTGKGGSYYENLSTKDLDRYLILAEWDPYESPQVKPPCFAYITKDIPKGVFGLVPLSLCSPLTPISLLDPKKTGFVSPYIYQTYHPTKTYSPFTVIILGPSDEEFPEELQVYTFHPGPPVAPSIVQEPEQETTVARARDLGFLYAHVILVHESIPLEQEGVSNVKPS